MAREIPEHIKDAIDRHVSEGFPCGGFVTAVLENNLREAFARGDDENLKCLHGIVSYCYNQIPADCWGSKKEVAEWRDGVRFARPEYPSSVGT